MHAFWSVHKALSRLFQRKQCEENLRENSAQVCDHEVARGDSVLADIYDGNVLQDFERKKILCKQIQSFSDNEC